MCAFVIADISHSSFQSFLAEGEWAMQIDICFD
jgi:hypothetical protein